MLKASIIAAVMVSAGVYLLMGSFLALVLYVWPVNATLSAPVGYSKAPSTVFQSPLGLGAEPSNLQVGINVQGQ